MAAPQSHPRNLAFVRGLGVDSALDYTETVPAQLGRYDVIVDIVGSDIDAYRRHLTARGRMVAVILDPPLRALGTVLASMRFGAQEIRFFNGDPQRALLADLASYVERGALRAVTDSVYPLEEIVAAHRAAQRRGGRGKRVIALR